MQHQTHLEKKYIHWDIGDSIATTSNIPLDAGIANFNQTLKLTVNMYFDTTNNKFVEKKVIMFVSSACILSSLWLKKVRNPQAV